MGPLARRAPWRLARSGIWGLLVTGAFLLLATAAASVPIFSEAAGNAALAARLATVPPDAVAGQAPVVRVVGGTGTVGQGRASAGLDQIPGLGPTTVTATSVGVESRPTSEIFTPFVSTGLTRDKPTTDLPAPPLRRAEGWQLERARIFGDDDLTAGLVPAPGSPSPASAAAQQTTGPPAVWLPAPLASALRVGPHDQVQVGVNFARDLDGDGRLKIAPAVVAGVYQVGSDGRMPLAPPGDNRWVERQDSLPADSEFRTLHGLLVLTDVASAGRLAAAVGEDLLYIAQSSLQPAIPTLDQATATVAGIRRREVEVRDPAQNADPAAELDQQVVSGVPTIVEDASAGAEATVAWTATAGAAGLGLGLLAVLAVAVFGLLRRGLEIRHAVGLGVRPTAIGALATVEVLGVAVVCTGAGVLTGWSLVAAVGPAGAITSTGVSAAGQAAALATGAGALIVGGTASLAAMRAGRLHAGSGPVRSVPWELLVLVAAMTAGGGLLLRPQTGGPPSVMDLLLPVLVLVAVGSVGARVMLWSASRLTALGSSRGPLSGAGWSRRPVLVLAVRRVAGGGRQAVLLITLLTVGFGFLAYSLAAAASTRRLVDDRVAVLAGARATVELEGESWTVDDGAARPAPPDPNLAASLPSTDPVPGARTPPLPAGLTVVWRTRITVPPEYGNLDLLVVDPARFAEVAAWGDGPELAGARGLLAPLSTADAEVAARLKAGDHRGPIPAIGVGDVLQRPGDLAAVSTLMGDVPIRVSAVVPAFPGANGTLPVIVVPADSFFLYFGGADPRVAPPAGASRFDNPPSEYSVELWSSTGVQPLRSLLQSQDLVPHNVTTYAQAAQQPDLVAAGRSTGYQTALGLCVAGLALLGLAMFAERAASRARAADLILTRMGMGRGGTRRARATELSLLALVALLLAGLGVAAIIPFGPRLLDPGGGGAPEFTLRLGAESLGAAGIALVVGVLLALAVTGKRTSAGSEAEVLRDAE